MMDTDLSGDSLVFPRAVLLDWDNTVVDSWPCIHEAITTTLVAMGHAPWTLEETRTRVGLSMREAFPLLFKERWQEAGQIFMARFREIHLEALVPLPGALAMVRALSGQGIRLGVVSNKTGALLRQEAQVLGIAELFDALVGAGDAPRDKPAPDPAFQALAPSGLAPGPEVWMVGDAVVDMELAHALGGPGILLRPEAPRPGEFGATPPCRHVTSCDAVLALVAAVGETAGASFAKTAQG
ncbi:HAD family hydrolase [Pararhodospirillum photometricum]|uniref:phosphoglycolate phosphatase n=1 Tax=Pararhodospirillum photometricum DSM 122 TaxID=1150469 RepID=H6SSG2_PARPM|nr:HAD hydrolase-like protein [Pararhodospirillum photometricum]CCG07841.1 HAD-superfamily hydrolase, subfamily IA, variant 1 [Pararhodospirillum photometricum DSM 122]